MILIQNVLTFGTAMHINCGLIVQALAKIFSSVSLTSP